MSAAPKSEVALAAAEQYGLDADDLVVVAQAQGRFALTGVSILSAKVYDQSTGRFYGVYLGTDGTPLDFEAAQSAEQAAYHDTYATMTRQLAGIVADAPARRLIPVGFWLHSDHASVVQRSEVRLSDPAAAAALAANEEALNQERVRDAVAAVTRPFAAELLGAGYLVDYVTPFSPAVFARVRAGDVAALAADPRVQGTYYTGDRVVETQNIAKQTTGATKVWPRGTTGGFTGIGVTGGVVECCDSLFEEVTDLDAENNAFLARIHEIRAGACGGTHSHPTAVSGIIASTSHNITGIGKDGRIVFDSACDGSQAGVVSAAQDVSAVVNGATNHSYGISTTQIEPCPTADGVGSIMERALDDLVRNGADSQYVAAGNDGNTRCVSSPAIAWNIVSVGAFDDNNTVPWAGDTMASFSSGGDPGTNNGDRQKPEVAGPGVNFTGLLPSAGGFPIGSIGSGTSYATPVYVGGAFLASHRAPTLLSWPEAEKAVMLASACHNIEGGQTTGELDGAGGPDFSETDDLLVANRFTFGSIANGSGIAVTVNFPGVVAGNELRVALAWDTNTAYSLYGSDPSDDLDLVLKRPDGSVAASSSTFDNTHEVIEFVANVGGTWTIEVNRFRTSDPAGSTFYGLAWHRYPPADCTSA